MGSTIRWFCQKAAAKVSPNYYYDKNNVMRGVMINKGSTSSGVVSSKSSSSKISSPWLMLPPAYDWDNEKKMVFNFYSLAEEKIVTSRGHESVGRPQYYWCDGIELVSSSHGWISLCNTGNLDLFLFNPISGSQIKLPHLSKTLDIKPHLDLYQRELYHGCVRKVITSCSPEQDDCRVLMSYGPRQNLAFCCPNKDDATWHPLPKPYLQDFVYSSRQKLFYSVDTFAGFEAINLQDVTSPKIIELNPLGDKENYAGPARSKDEKSLTFLVVSEKSGDVFWVRRHVMPRVALDGSYVDDIDDDQQLPYKTIGFDVYKYDEEKCALVYMDGSLDGLAFFIGNNHSFALFAGEYPGLKANSIYFTDVHELIPNVWSSTPPPYGGHDLGIFDYENRTLSPCYYTCERQSIHRIVPAPMWFTPTS